MPGAADNVIVPTLLRRKFEFRLDPCSSLEPLDATGRAWRACDAAPWFNLVPRGGRFPRGWVLMQCRLVRRASDFTATLQFDTGGGFDDARAIRPPVTRRGVLLEILRLPSGIRAMRWQPMQSPGLFEQSPLVMTEIGWVERVTRMGQRVIGIFFQHPRAKLEKVGLTPWRALCRLPAAYEASGRLRAYAPALPYPLWVERFDTLSDRDRELIRAHIGRLVRRPLISVLMPVRGAPEDMLRRAIESVRAQLYPLWELCLGDDSSAGPEVRRLLEHHADADARIRLASRDPGGRGPEVSGFALPRAQGEYVALLDSGGLLAQHALYMVAAEINAHPDVAAVYSDEDRVDPLGHRFGAYHKPDWNPELARGQNLLGRLAVYRTSLVRQVGGLRPGFEGSEEYDLALRVAERAPGESIRHVPRVLYHARAGEGAPEPERMPGAREAGRRALEEHLARVGVAASVAPVPGIPYFGVRYAVPEPGPLVSIVIPTRDRCELLRLCVESIFDRTRYANFEIVLVDNASSEPAAVEYLERLSRRERVRRLRDDRPFNYSALNNLGVRAARGPVLCLLNNDTEVIAPDWLEAMLGHLLQPGVAVVGAKLLYPEDLVQHAGVLLNVTGVAGHAHAFFPRNDPGYFGRALLAQDFSAVTGACMMVRREVYEGLGGLDEVNLPVAFNDVDFCLRVREAGHRVLWTPDALLYHHESVSRGAEDTPEKKKRFAREKAFMRRRWKAGRDPFYNPNLSHERPDFSLSNAPMDPRPWLE